MQSGDKLKVRVNFGLVYGVRVCRNGGQSGTKILCSDRCLSETGGREQVHEQMHSFLSDSHSKKSGTLIRS